EILVKLENFDLIITDFDGVLTDNRVIVSENGEESVVCSRSDGLAIEILRKIGKEILILSTEKNKVVKARSEKLLVEVVYGAGLSKHNLFRKIVDEKKIDLLRTVYIGNDLNDFYVMRECGYKICPSDSHEKIKELADYITVCKGGEGVFRDFLEKILKVDVLKLLA
ncbi:MAG: HAD hydrolase family protein, partial [Spirochaetia bacterium]|nr:HAD hydrolase family protein [Spirochaetia bacterium]